jgi:RNA polymerase sigma factor (TIGR02999 family)
MSEALTDAVYAQLRAIAQRQMADERAGHTLQATALVHEAYMRLSRHEKTWGSEGEFYGAAAEAMRRILIEHARKRGAVKRGGEVKRVIFNVAELASEDDAGAILRLDEAILRFEKEEPRAASVVRLRFYAGLTVEQTAAALGLSRNTVLRDWEYARAWLKDALWE